jgi:hypothetical protein
MREKVTFRQHKVIENMVAGKDISTIAHELKVSRQSIYRWLQQPGFQSALQDASKKVLEELTRHLTALGGKAISTLDEALDDPLPTNLGVRVRAATAVLDRILTLRELVDLETRVNKLEEQYVDQK